MGRRKISYILPIVILLLFLVALGTLYVFEEQGRLREPVTEQSGAMKQEETFPVFTEEVLLCSDAVKKLYDGQMAVETVIQTEDPYRAFALEYDMGVQTGVFYLGENADLSDAREYPMEIFQKVLRIDNLKTGTVYYYKAVIGDEAFSGSFVTAESTRFLTIPGADNVRDIGGYRNLDGKMVRQGLLIRGTELDGLEYEDYKLNPDNVETVQSDFGFVYDFDLRAYTIFEGEYQSALGEDVGHAFYTAPQYEQIFEPEWQVNLQKIFTDLADPAKYPMYLHCTWGKDRTGTVVFLLQGILNMSDEDMMTEYRLSGFVHSEMAEENAMEAVTQELMKYEGRTLQEKIVTFMTTDVGITEEQLDSIRTIFLEK